MGEKKKKKWGLWDYLLWPGIILILAWALLKSFNVINTPMWVEMLPYFGIGVVFIASVFKAGKMVQNIETMGTNISGFKEKTDKINDNLISLSKHVSLRDETIKKHGEDLEQFKNPKK